MDEQKKTELYIKLGGAFRPGAPIDQYRLFSGRQKQVKEILATVSQVGRHVIIFGERGVGKTSLAKILSEVLAKAGLKILDSGTINCDPTDDFSSLWHKVFRELSVALESQQVGFTSTASATPQSLDCLLPETVRPDDIRFVLKKVPDQMLIIIDELNELRDDTTRSLLANTVKTLSDHLINATLILIGVADSVNSLIAEHVSIERALVQVPMPKMSWEELSQVIDYGLKTAEMTIDDPAKSWICWMSHGLPHFTHSLALYAAHHAVDDGRTNITMLDVASAAAETVNNSHRILRAHNMATVSPQRSSLYAKVLLACALCNKDSLGYFAASDVKRPMSAIMHKTYEVPHFSHHLHELSEPERGDVLRKQGTPRKHRFCFSDPMMEPFVIIHGFANKLLNDEVLASVMSSVSPTAPAASAPLPPAPHSESAVQEKDLPPAPDRP
ncbi:MAG: ATP-binding protein [Candidatus Binatia bacterium]